MGNLQSTQQIKNWCANESCKNGDIASLKFFIKQGAILDISHIQTAIKNNQLDTVKFLWDPSGRNFFNDNFYHNRIVFTAINNVEILKYLVNNGVLISSYSTNNALSCNNPEVLNYFFEINAPFDDTSIFFCKDIKILKRVVENGAPTEYYSFKNMERFNMKYEFIKYLIWNKSNLGPNRMKEEQPDTYNKCLGIIEEISKEITPIIIEFIGPDVSSVIINYLNNFSIFV